MLKESSNNNNKNVFSKTNSIANEKMICKDGFCSLPNKNASKFFTLYLFYIFIHLYNGAILERLAKSKKVKK